MSKVLNLQIRYEVDQSWGFEATEEIGDRSRLTLENLLSMDGERQQDIRSDGRSNETSLPLLGSSEFNDAQTLVEGTIEARAHRRRLFPPELFADPAWDMLLELYRSHLRQLRISVTNLCIASHVPLTTALRWLTTMERLGLVSRSADPLDGRRYYMQITAAGSVAMTRYLSELSDLGRRGACA